MDDSVSIFAFAGGFVYEHTCTLRVAGVEDSYGHDVPDWNNVTAYEGIICRWQEITTRRMAELFPAGAAVGDHEMWLDEGDVPAVVLEEGGQRSLRVVDLERDDGTLIDAGPFDVARIERLSGAEGVLHILLKRVA